MKLAFFILSSFSLAFAAESLEQSPRFFTHILDYIAVDYPGAVENGKILNADEYKEQIEFSQTVLRLAGDLPELKVNQQIHQELQTLHFKILNKADAAVVSALARKISQQAVALCKIQNVPERWPNLHRGKKIYGQNCAQCHGQHGRGDGPSGGELDPKPANFHADKADDLPPFQLFNAIRLGVPGTAMASFSHFSDTETWDLAFYVLSLRHGNGASNSPKSFVSNEDFLSAASLKSDKTLREETPGTEAEKRQRVTGLRLLSSEEGSEIQSLDLAEDQLKSALHAFRNKNYDAARTSAIVAYLDGIEPVEPRLRAKDYAFTQALEKKFASVRAAIEARVLPSDLETQIDEALAACRRARELLKKSEGSTIFTFSVAAGIFMREGFEAALILITLLGIVRSVGAPQAALSIHVGWISALGFGVFVWFFSGWILNMSGAQREMLEGIVSGFAVLVLLYFGFWLHRKTEIGRWRVFIQDMTRKAVSKKSLFALGGVAFMGVFRECFETVLFLRALLIEAGPKQHWAMAMGVLSAFVLVLLLSYGLIRQSARVPVRKLFQISSVILVLLSLVLVGKMMHAFQETGMVGITPVSLPFQADLFGVFPTVETLVSQVVVLVGIFLVVFIGNQISGKDGKLA